MARANKSNDVFGIKNTFLEVRSSAIEGDTCDDVFAKPPIRQFTDPCPATRSYSLSSDDYAGTMRQISASQASTDETHAPMPAVGRSNSILEENESDDRRNHEFKDDLGADSLDAFSDLYERQVTEQQWPAWPDTNVMLPVSNQQMFSPENWCGSVPVMLQAPVAPDEWASYTTVMMRNLPNKYTQQMLLEKLHELGFAGTFDFLYLPIDRETNANKGYCFINFSEPYYAWMLKTTCEGQKMGRFNSSKEVSVVPASLQGFEANYAHYSNTNVNRGDPAARPLFLREPDPVQHRKARHGGGSRKSQSNATKQQQVNPDSPSSNIAAPPSGSQADVRSTYIEKGYSTNSGQGKGQGKSSENIQASQHMGQISMDACRKPRFCPFCGTKREENFNFCTSCGQAVAQS
eukprot:TRINITY_DN15280_c0_g1_i1.p1 TRINITY_DN15280_c0_g1~~TRINITY_DN15280_c0_g1_i1.p1  ORF type:complete len:405 (+),score=62.35 TRINITY_DN15280_c0_g1_i1:184-1398(+)